MRITKRFTFSASHRLFNPTLTDEENKKLFEECNRSHGHNFILDITVEGEVNPRTGMIINFHELRKIVEENVITYFDHKDFEHDIAEFKGKVQTVENLAAVIWGRLVGKMPGYVMLVLIRVAETESNWVEFGGTYK